MNVNQNQEGQEDRHIRRWYTSSWRVSCHDPPLTAPAVIPTQQVNWNDTQKLKS